VIITVSGRGEPDVVHDVALAVTSAMSEAGVTRLVAASSSAMIATKPRVVAGVVRRIFAEPFAEPFADQAAADAHIRITDLDWTVARATRLIETTPKRGTCQHRPVPIRAVFPRTQRMGRRASGHGRERHPRPPIGKCHRLTEGGRDQPPLAGVPLARCPGFDATLSATTRRHRPHHHRDRCNYAPSVSQPRSVFYVASATAGTVTVYAVVEAPTLRLQQVQIVEVGPDVAALALHPNRAVLYASVRSGPAVVAMSIDARSGRLDPICDVQTSSPWVSLKIAPSGRLLFGASYRDHVVVSIALDDRGTPATEATDAFLAGSHPHCIVPAPDGSVWISVLGDDVVLRVPVEDQGRFSRTGIRATRLPEGFGPRHLVVAPRRGEILVIGERSGDIARIAIRGGTVAGRWSTLPPAAGLAPGIVRELDRENATVDADGRPLMWAADITLSPNEDIVYTCERRTSVLSVSSVRAGALRRVMPTVAQPRGIALDPAGRYLLATGELAATVTMYAVDPDDGDLEPVAHAPVPAGALWVESLALAPG
jgi:6-phosphogluconolactonase